MRSKESALKFIIRHWSDLSGKEIAAKVGVSRQMIYLYIHQMKKNGVKLPGKKTCLRHGICWEKIRDYANKRGEKVVSD